MTEQMQNTMLPIGTLLQGGKYRVERYMASGGFGNTYEVVHTKLKRRFALKEFFLSGDCLRGDDGLSVTVSVPTKASLFASMREKFEKEAQRMYDLTEEGSPHVVRVIDLFDENLTSYYVMELIEGESLGKRLKTTNRPLSEQEVMALLPQILDALDGVHRHRIWHLDLKPDNLMVDSRGHVTLIDFGASKQMSASGDYSSTLSAMCYTPGYAPSEQIDQNIQLIGPWTDFYALGATLYKLLTNQQPPQVSAINNAFFGGQDAFSFTPAVSSWMQQFVRWMMNPAIPNRPQSVGDIRQLFSGGKDVADEQTKPNPHEEPLVADSNKTVYGSPQPQQPVLLPVIQRLIDNMVFVQGGTFRMGSESELSEADSDNQPAHDVTISDFYIGRFQVTQEEWETVMGNNPSMVKGKNHPVECVSWNDCQEFIAKLNEISGKVFRLPTEAEWEFAARGGVKSQGYKYAGSNEIDDVAWYESTSNGDHVKVGEKRPNELGLYDMSGNVWEWCHDWYGDYPSSPQTNPKGPTSGSRRVDRGGSWYGDARLCRVSSRSNDSPSSRDFNLGLRLACSAL